jgi:hypothetical protein
MATLAPLVEKTGARWCSWVKGFAAFKRNVPVGYAWEPVIIKPGRKPVVSKRLVMRDWIQESITLKRGLTGAKPGGGLFTGPLSWSAPAPETTSTTYSQAPARWPARGRPGKANSPCPYSTGCGIDRNAHRSMNAPVTHRE